MNYTKFEKARLIGARALQIKMGAPILVKVPKSIEKPIDIAKLELEKGVLPITIKAVEDIKIKKKKIVLPEILLAAEEDEVEEVKGEKEEKEEKEAPEEEIFEEETIVAEESD